MEQLDRTVVAVINLNGSYVKTRIFIAESSNLLVKKISTHLLDWATSHDIEEYLMIKKSL